MAKVKTVTPGTSGYVGPFGNPSPQLVASSALPSRSTLGSIAIEVGAVFVLTLYAGTNEPAANLCVAILLTLWVLRLIHYYST